MEQITITDALNEIIEANGGTASEADENSITHALGTLYETLGGSEELPNDVAERVRSLSSVIGGGGGANTATITVINNTDGTRFLTFPVLMNGYFWGSPVPVEYATPTNFVVSIPMGAFIDSVDSVETSGNARAEYDGEEEGWFVYADGDCTVTLIRK